MDPKIDEFIFKELKKLFPDIENDIIEDILVEVSILYIPILYNSISHMYLITILIIHIYSINNNLKFSLNQL